MENTLNDTSNIAGGFFGIPDLRRILQLLVYVPIFFAILVGLFGIYIQADSASKIKILFGTVFVVSTVLLSKLFHTIEKRKKINTDKTQSEEDTFLKEYDEVLSQAQGNLKNLLQQALTEGGTNAFYLVKKQENSVASLVFRYIQTKIQFEKEKERLNSLITLDISTPEISIDGLMEMNECLVSYTKLLENLAVSLLAFMPNNTEEIFKVEDLQLYINVLLEENSWVEHEALRMQDALDEWTTNHLREVKQNRNEFEKNLSNEKLAYGDLLFAASTLREGAFTQIRVQQ